MADISTNLDTTIQNNPINIDGNFGSSNEFISVVGDIKTTQPDDMTTSVSDIKIEEDSFTDGTLGAIENVSNGIEEGTNNVIEFADDFVNEPGYAGEVLGNVGDTLVETGSKAVDYVTEMVTKDPLKFYKDSQSYISDTIISGVAGVAEEVENLTTAIENNAGKSYVGAKTVAVVTGAALLAAEAFPPTRTAGAIVKNLPDVPNSNPVDNGITIDIKKADGNSDGVEIPDAPHRLEISDDDATEIFDGAQLAQKQVTPVAVITNTSDHSISVKTILKDGTVESGDANVHIPAGEKAVVQPGGEINVMPKFDEIYEDNKPIGDDALKTHADDAMKKAGVNPDDVEVSAAKSKQRVDEYVALPNGADNKSQKYELMQPWGENGALVPQGAKSGDMLVRNNDGSIYFNSREGTVSGFIDAKTGKPILDIIDDIKIAPLDILMKTSKNNSGGNFGSGAAGLIGLGVLGAESYLSNSDDLFNGVSLYDTAFNAPFVIPEISFIDNEINSGLDNTVFANSWADDAPEYGPPTLEEYVADTQEYGPPVSPDYVADNDSTSWIDSITDLWA